MEILGEREHLELLKVHTDRPRPDASVHSDVVSGSKRTHDPAKLLRRLVCHNIEPSPTEDLEEDMPAGVGSGSRRNDALHRG